MKKATIAAFRGNPQRAMILGLASLQAFAPAGMGRTVPKSSHPLVIDDSMKSLIKAFAGSWAIHLSSDASEPEANGSVGNGEEIWRAGPGSNSLIEEYNSTGTEGDIAGLGIFWREENDKRFKVFWCDNTAPVACRTLRAKTDWRGGRLVLLEDRHEKGKKHVFQETFAFDTPDSFTQTLAEGESIGTLKPILTIRATRIKTIDYLVLYKVRIKMPMTNRLTQYATLNSCKLRTPLDTLM